MDKNYIFAIGDRDIIFLGFLLGRYTTLGKTGLNTLVLYKGTLYNNFTLQISQTIIKSSFAQDTA